MEQKQITSSRAIEGYFIAAQARQLSPGTLADYDHTLARFEAFLGSDLPLADITSDHIRRYLNSLSGVSAKTALNHHTGLAALWTWAVKEGLAQADIERAHRGASPVANWLI